MCSPVAELYNAQTLEKIDDDLESIQDIFFFNVRVLQPY
jgi:hypothetical protein